MNLGEHRAAGDRLDPNGVHRVVQRVFFDGRLGGGVEHAVQRRDLSEDEQATAQKEDHLPKHHQGIPSCEDRRVLINFSRC